MYASLNTNLAASSTARALNAHYGRLATSVQRLSTGLRINSAADDAAGLAIRELQRVDIAALHQGMRNANDAISLTQVADGALAIIDEKLIRMKELAEQAATGTYSSTQRLMIESEYQAMADEIDRPDKPEDKEILDKLVAYTQRSTNIAYELYQSKDPLDKTPYYAYTENGTTHIVTDREYPLTFANNKTLADLEPVVNVVSGRIPCDVYVNKDNPAEKYFTKDNGASYFTRMDDPEGSKLTPDEYAAIKGKVQKIDQQQYIVRDFDEYVDNSTNPPTNYYTSDNGQTYYINRNRGGEPDLKLPDHAVKIATLAPVPDQAPQGYVYYEYEEKDDSSKKYYTIWRSNEEIFLSDKSPFAAPALDINNPAHQAAIANLVTKAQTSTATVIRDFPGIYYVYEDPQSGTLYYSADGGETFTTSPTDPYSQANYLVPNNPADKAIIDNLREKVTTVRKLVYVDLSGGATVATQEDAQMALEGINRAIERKDKIRAHIGALQNRLENTVTNLNIQAENLQASESRISDTDVATEMTNFVRNQILTQSATAMLAQANSMPQMLTSLVQG